MTVRPALIGLAAALLAGVLAGCDGGPPSRTPDPSAVPSTAAGCARPSVGPDGPVLRPGPSNGLAASTAVGEPLALAALVLGADCRPAAGAEVNLWHADARGRYGPEGSEECCYYAGTVRTDPAGRFRLDTVRPARYPERGAPPAHIHLEIRHPAGRVDTELIFDRPAPTGPAGPSGHVLPVALRRDGPGWRGEVVFVLSGPA